MLQHLLSPLLSLQHTPLVTIFPNRLHSYGARNHVPGSVLRSLRPLPFVHHCYSCVLELLRVRPLLHGPTPLVICLLAGVLQDSWSWQDLLSGDIMLVPIKRRKHQKMRKNVFLTVCSNGSPQTPGGMRHTRVSSIAPSENYAQV